MVEDNSINQQVAKELLQNIGLVVEIANNGLEAINLIVKQHDFDAVLMDIQMPIMDGYSATQAIRNKLHLKELPIIAMTAHAFESDHKKCLAAGMNDYMSKPIDPELLYERLLQWIKPSKRVISPINTLTELTEDDELYKIPLQLAGIDVADGLNRMSGNHTLFQKLLLELQQDYADSANQLRTFLDNNSTQDIESASQLIHSIKGMTGNISAKRLHQAADDLEMGIREEKTQEWLTLLDSFDDAAKEVFNSIQSLKIDTKKRPTHVAIKNLDRSTVTPLLIELTQSIKHHNLNAIEQFNSLKPLINLLTVQK